MYVCKLNINQKKLLCFYVRNNANTNVDNKAINFI